MCVCVFAFWVVALILNLSPGFPYMGHDVKISISGLVRSESLRKPLHCQCILHPCQIMLFSFILLVLIKKIIAKYG